MERMPQSVKIMSWNIASVPDIVSKHGSGVKSVNERLVQIILYILSVSDSVDVIMFNEVFLYQSIIIGELKGIYPFYVHLGR